MRTYRDGINAAIAFAASVLLTACGSASGPATVMGRVTLDGKPVSHAFIVVVGQDGRASLPALIRADGSYTIDRAPVGEVKISIDGVPDIQLPLNSPPASSAGAFKDPELALIRQGIAAGVRAPKRFKNPNESGIILSLKPGLNAGCDIDLGQ